VIDRVQSAVDTPVAMATSKTARHHAAELGIPGRRCTDDMVARDTGFVWSPTASGFDHLTQATIVDGRGRVFQQVYGESFELPMFVGPLKELATGSPAPVQDLAGIFERVRILCTVYDPRAGRYRLNYGLIIEILVGLSVLGGTIAYLGNEWLHQHRI
jgi:protein SCO1/2